jgi:hypothetical protein
VKHPTISLSRTLAQTVGSLTEQQEMLYGKFVEISTALPVQLTQGTVFGR